MTSNHHHISLQRLHSARLASVQCVYARLAYPSISHDDLFNWVMELKGEERLLKPAPNKKLFRSIFYGAEENRTAIEADLERILASRWFSHRMPAVMRAIFYCATYEFLYTPKLNTNIIIDQYVGVSDAFLDDSDTGFVNGALQEIARDIRPSPPEIVSEGS